MQNVHPCIKYLTSIVKVTLLLDFKTFLMIFYQEWEPPLQLLDPLEQLLIHILITQVKLFDLIVLLIAKILQQRGTTWKFLLKKLIIFLFVLDFDMIQ